MKDMQGKENMLEQEKTFSNTSRKNKKLNSINTIDLVRSEVKTSHYFATIGVASMGLIAALMLSVYERTFDTVVISHLFPQVHSLVLLAVSFILLTATSLYAVQNSSKSYNSEITSVFSYMQRKNKRKFDLSTYGNEKNLGFFRKRVELLSLQDNELTGQTEVLVRDSPLVFEQKRMWENASERVSISDIKEVSIGNQSDPMREAPVFLEKNRIIKKMIFSKHQRTVAMLVVYMYAFLAGFFIFLVIF